MEEEIVRVRVPRKGEILGTVKEMLGASRFKVECQDGKERICRVPGKIKRKVWVVISDLVLIQPWDVQPEDRGDIVWRYTRTQANWIRRRGYYKDL